MYDIIPDIHGQSGKLHALLARLGWRLTPAGWVNDDPTREIVFLGDFIDRGPDNAGVLATVRSLVDSGKARAVMGNHELNAIHFHSADPETGQALRAHSPKNLRQHASFLEEFPVGAAKTGEVVDWMATLPLFLETEAFRAVHACWDESRIAALKSTAPDGVLSKDQMLQAADKHDPLFALVDPTTKGPEVALPMGYVFRDKDGTERREVRLKWWESGATAWADIAMSVPDPDELPITAVPASVAQSTYPAHAKPVFFGHYWLSGEFVLQAHNALCLDYSAGKAGPLVAYRLEEPAAPLSLARIVSHSETIEPHTACGTR